MHQRPRVILWVPLAVLSGAPAWRDGHVAGRKGGQVGHGEKGGTAGKEREMYERTLEARQVEEETPVRKAYCCSS